MSDQRASNVIATVAVAKALTGDTKAIELLNKYEEDAPIGVDGNEKPVVNITLVQAENREQLHDGRKEVTINGVSFPINVKETDLMDTYQKTETVQAEQWNSPGDVKEAGGVRWSFLQGQLRKWWHCATG